MSFFERPFDDFFGFSQTSVVYRIQTPKATEGGKQDISEYNKTIKFNLDGNDVKQTL